MHKVTSIDSYYLTTLIAFAKLLPSVVKFLVHSQQMIFVTMTRTATDGHYPAKQFEISEGI